MFVIAKTLTMRLQQFLNIVVINILQSRVIGQFDEVLDDSLLFNSHSSAAERVHV
jgi:hypothetical protein